MIFLTQENVENTISKYSSVLHSMESRLDESSDDVLRASIATVEGMLVALYAVAGKPVNGLIEDDNECDVDAVRRDIMRMLRGEVEEQ